MSTYLLVDKITQDCTEMWISMSHHASASRCDKKQLYRRYLVVAISSVMSSIDLTNMKLICKCLHTKPSGIK